MSLRETPMRLKRSGSAPSWARLYSAGSSLRLARSPVPPKMTSVVGWTGSRSRPSTSGFSGAAVVGVTPCLRPVGALETDAGHPGRRSSVGPLLHGVAAELRAQRREHLARELAVVARVEARVERARQHGHRHVLGHPVLERPAALARVGGVRVQRGEVVALQLER